MNTQVALEALDVRNLSDDDIRAYHELTLAMQSEARPDDPPATLEMTEAFLRNIPSTVDVAGFAARDDGGGFAGVGYGIILQTGENEHLVQVGIEVRPEHRRRGIGRTLLARLAGVAEAGGQSLLVASTNERVPAGAAFAERFGAEAANDAHVNRLLLDDVDRGLVDAWIADGPVRAAGYSLLSVDGRYPDELLDAITDLSHVMNTAPRGSLQIEDTHTTPARMRENETMLLSQGNQRWSLFARHDASGDLVGYSEVAWNPAQPQIVQQLATAVRPEHRGHAIGKWLKAAMLKRILAERPDAIDVRTGNADSNAAMLSINYQLGFQPFIASTSWQVSVEKVKAHLAQ